MPGAAGVRGLAGRLASGWQMSWLRESSVLVSAQGTALLTSSLLLVVIARALGPATLGVFAGFFGAAVAANGIVELGLSTWLLRELAATWYGDSIVADATSRRSELISVATSLVALAAVLVLCAGAITAIVAGFSPGMTAALLALLAYGVLSGIALVLEVGFRASRGVRTPALATFLEKGLLILLVGVALLLHAGIIALSASYLPGAIARLAFDVRRLRSEQGISIRIASSDAMWQAAKAASPFTVNTLVLVVITRLDVVLVAAVSTVSAGFYSVADRSLTALIVFPILSCITLYPHLAGQPNRIRQAWKLGIAAAGAVALVAGVVGAAAPALVPLVFGLRYKPAVHLLQILLLSGPALIYSQMMLVSVFTERREKIAVLCVTVSLVVGTGAFLVGLLEWGATGAAVGAVVRSFLFVLSVLVLGRRRTEEGRPGVRALWSRGSPARLWR